MRRPRLHDERSAVSHRRSVQPLSVQARRLASEPSHQEIPPLAKRFFEPLRGENPAAPRRLGFPKPTLVPTTIGFPGQHANTNVHPNSPKLPRPAVRQGKRGLSRNGWVSALVVLALIPLTMLFVRLWQDMVVAHAVHGTPPAKSIVSGPPARTALAQAEQRPSTLEVALSSPDRIEANAGQVIEFPVAIDAMDALPVRSIIAVTALPEGASFSQGRPYGATGWSLRPDELADLQLRLPERGGASDMRLELIAGDGTVLAGSETGLSIAPSPPDTAAVAASPSTPFEQVATAETTRPIDSSSPPPPQKLAASAEAAPEVKVNTVKVVTIPAPQPGPHDGGYALGPAPAEPKKSAEWMVTKAAVDMHAKAEKSSETVKVAGKGLKLRVMARHKKWVQVTDPKTSTTGWIYDRFLTPTEPAVH
jgi:hypothetical protein